MRWGHRAFTASEGYSHTFQLPPPSLCQLSELQPQQKTLPQLHTGAAHFTWNSTPVQVSAAQHKGRA